MLRIEQSLDIKMLAEDNKENAPMEVQKEPKLRHVGEEGEEVVLRPKIRKDKNNPFVMTHMRPQLNEPQAQNRNSRYYHVLCSLFIYWTYL